MSKERAEKEHLFLVELINLLKETPQGRAVMEIAAYNALNINIKLEVSKIAKTE